MKEHQRDIDIDNCFEFIIEENSDLKNWNHHSKFLLIMYQIDLIQT